VECEEIYSGRALRPTVLSHKPDPSRGSAAAIVELIGLLELVIELFGKHIEKQKRTSYHVLQLEK
jgi:hypothetical protein